MQPLSLFTRHTCHTGELTLSYLDTGGDAPLLLCLHALWMQGISFAALAPRLMPDWRIVAPDLRCHGRSDRAADTSRDAFLRDLDALLDQLDPSGPVVLLGNSLGGTCAFQYAARHPDRVRALIIEEAPAEEHMQLDFIRTWAGARPDVQTFARDTGPLFWSLAPSLTACADGVRLMCDPDDLMAVQRDTNGDWWADWTASSCPALVLRGSHSRAVSPEILQAMAQRRAHTREAVIDAGHVIHEDNPAATARVIRAFLKGL